MDCGDENVEMRRTSRWAANGCRPERFSYCTVGTLPFCASRLFGTDVKMDHPGVDMHCFFSYPSYSHCCSSHSAHYVVKCV